MAAGWLGGEPESICHSYPCKMQFLWRFPFSLSLPCLQNQGLLFWWCATNESFQNGAKVPWEAMGNTRDRLTECSGLEGTSGDHLVQLPTEAGSPTADCTGPCPGHGASNVPDDRFGLLPVLSSGYSSRQLKIKPIRTRVC